MSKIFYPLVKNIISPIFLFFFLFICKLRMYGTETEFIDCFIWGISGRNKATPHRKIVLFVKLLDLKMGDSYTNIIIVSRINLILNHWEIWHMQNNTSSQASLWNKIVSAFFTLIGICLSATIIYICASFTNEMPILLTQPQTAQKNNK